MAYAIRYMVFKDEEAGALYMIDCGSPLMMWGEIFTQLQRN